MTVKLETNIFAITNLAELSSRYRLYRIRGLHKDQAEFHQNKNIITRKISFALRTPAAVISHQGEPHLVVREDAPEPPSPYQLVRTTVYFDVVPGNLNLDYSVRTPENDEICLRFLQFMLQAPLSNNQLLWQPGAGQPFFRKEPRNIRGDLSLYGGCAVRAVATPDGGLGLCVDVCHKLVSRNPLPIKMTRTQFRPWRGRHCIYRFGHRWYDIQLHEFSDLNVTETLLPLTGGNPTLLQYIVAECRKPIPEELSALPHDASVVHYLTNRSETRSAPAGLCFPVHDTQGEGGNGHRESILRPHERREMIRRFVAQFLVNLKFGDAKLNVATEACAIPHKLFQIPDYEFGNGRILSVRGTPGAQQVSLDSIGRTRAGLLRDHDAGFYSNDRLDRQYLFLPQSVEDGFGSQFRTDLKRTVEELYPKGGGYNPILVPYDDRRPRTFVEQGKAILEAAERQNMKDGFALVMIHHTSDKQIRQHDHLAAMVIRKFREFDVFAAVNHSAMGQECYRMATGRDGRPYYEVANDKRGKFSGYLRNVALNKILLTNEKWPFVLASQLHADVTVGIDVKQNTAGFTVIARGGSIVRTVCHQSNQKERLLSDQVRRYFCDILRKEADCGTTIKTIVVHRDGRVWQSEIDGMKKGLEILRKEGVVQSDATLTIVEISKSSPAPLRLFDTSVNGQTKVENPQVGQYYIGAGGDGYLCATGRAFARAGTAKPLHVRFVEGSLPFEACLEDLYSLTALTWTRPEDCARDPITIKLTDRRLGEDASEYDADALEFEPDEEEAHV